MVWYNSDIKVGGKTLFNKRLFQAGLWTIPDMFNKGEIIGFNIWKDRGAKLCDFMIWRGLVNSIKHYISTSNNFADVGYIKIKKDCF